MEHFYLFAPSLHLEIAQLNLDLNAIKNTIKKNILIIFVRSKKNGFLVCWNKLQRMLQRSYQKATKQCLGLKKNCLICDLYTIQNWNVKPPMTNKPTYSIYVQNYPLI